MFSGSRSKKFAALMVCSVSTLASASALAAEAVSITDVPVFQRQYQLGAMSSVRTSQGSFDPYGNYVAYPSGSSSVTTMVMLNGSYRFSKRWEVGGSLSYRMSEMKFPTGTMSSKSFGNPSTDARFHAGGWPHVILHLGASFPLAFKVRHIQGEPMASMSDDLGDSGMIGNSVNLRAGAGVSRTFGRFRASMDGTVSYLFDSHQPSDPTNPNSRQLTMGKALRYQASEGGSYRITERWSASLSLKQIWAGENSIDGVSLPGTASRAFTTGVGVSYTPSPSLRWVGSYDSQFPFYAYAANQSFSPSVSVGMSYQR